MLSSVIVKSRREGCPWEEVEVGVGLEFSGRVQSIEGLQSYWAVALPRGEI